MTLEHARELLDELEPGALEIRDRIVRLVGELVAADGEWGATLARVDELVVAMGADSRRDMPERHELAGAIHDLRRAADAVSVLTPPLPHFAGRAAQQRDEKAAQLLQLRRMPRPTEPDEAEMTRLRRELNGSETPAA